MRTDENLRPFFEGQLDGRQRRPDPGIAGDLAAFDGHVQIFANQDPLASEVLVHHAQHFHGLKPQEAFDQAIVVSSMRLEKPHSLSYQEQTLTRVPSLTRVSVES